MGIFSKESKDVSAGSSRHRWRDYPKALIKKFTLFFFMIFFFAIYNQSFIPSSEPHTQYLNQAFAGEIGWGQAFKMTVWQGLEFGTKNLFELAGNLATYLGNSQPVEAIFLAGFPLFLVFVIWLIPVTMVFDIADQRKRKETAYWIQILVAIVVMVVSSLMINGAYMFQDMRANQACDELGTFQKQNQTYLECRIGEINHTISPGMYTEYDLDSDTWQRNMSGGSEFPVSTGDSNNSTNSSSGTGFLGGLVA